MSSLRALIRHAVVQVLRQDVGLCALLSGRVFSNRVEHWLPGELPAAGVYTLVETALDSDISPQPDERRISLAVELLVHMSKKADDALDELAQAVEDALSLPAIGAAMTAIVNQKLEDEGKAPLPPETIAGIPRSSAVDTLLLIKLTGIEIGVAVEGKRQIGVAALNYDLEYAVPWKLAETDILQGVSQFISGWDAAPADGEIDMESRVELSVEE